MTPPRVHFLVPGDIQTRTGGYIYDNRIVSGLRDEGWNVDVLSLDQTFPHPSRRALRHAARVLQSIPGGGVVVVDGLALTGIRRLVRDEAGRFRVVGLIHHPLALETGLPAGRASQLERQETEALAEVSGVIVTSAWTAGVVRGTYRVAPERIRVVEPGVGPTGARKRLRQARRQIDLLCVATLTARKGHAVLLDALSSLRDLPWRLTCIGSTTRDRATAHSVTRQVSRLRLRSRVQFLGEVSDELLARHYAQSDVFVLASYMEGYGMVFAEALAYGLPVIGTDAGAIAGTVPADARILVPPGDSSALAVVLRRVIEDARYRRELTSGAAEASRHTRSWDVAASEFGAALIKLLR